MFQPKKKDRRRETDRDRQNSRRNKENQWRTNKGISIKRKNNTPKRENVLGEQGKERKYSSRNWNNKEKRESSGWSMN